MGDAFTDSARCNDCGRKCLDPVCQACLKNRASKALTQAKTKLERSLDWLRENYSHIWFDPDLSRGVKAGFLAACCHPTRCYLMTLSLKDRVSEIMRELP